MIKCLVSLVTFSLLLLLAKQEAISQTDFQSKVDDAFVTYMCDCLSKNESKGNQVFLDAFLLDCPRAFMREDFMNLVVKAIKAGEMEDPGSQEAYQQFEKKSLALARDNTINRAIDACDNHKKVLLQIRDEIVTELLSHGTVDNDFTLKEAQEAFKDDPIDIQAQQILYFGMIFHYRGLKEKALAFYKASYDLEPSYRTKGYLHMVSR